MQTHVSTYAPQCLFKNYEKGGQFKCVNSASFSHLGLNFVACTIWFCTITYEIVCQEAFEFVPNQNSMCKIPQRHTLESTLHMILGCGVQLCGLIQKLLKYFHTADGKFCILMGYQHVMNSKAPFDTHDEHALLRQQETPQFGNYQYFHCKYILLIMHLPQILRNLFAESTSK